MDCVLIGPSDVSSLWRFGSVKKINYLKFVKEYASFLFRHFSNVIVTPDDGVCADVAQAFSNLTKKKPIAFYPDKDFFYGTQHVEKNYSKYDLKPIEGDWYKLNADLTKKSLCVICLGFSPGALIELSYIKYHQKYGSLHDSSLSNIHLFIDSRCIESKLPSVFKEQIKNMYYFSSFSCLEKLLTKKKAFSL